MREIADSQIANKSDTTTWFNPVEQRYFKALNPKSMTPDYGIPITNPGKMKGLGREHKAISNLQGAAASTTELDESRYKGVFTNDAEDDAVNFYDRFDKARKQYYQSKDLAQFIGAGTVTASDYSAIANVMLDQTVLELIQRDFIILDAFNRKSWDKLVYTFDSKTPYQNVGGLGELDIVPSTSITYARSSATLQKAQGHVSVSIWAGLAVRDHNIETDNTSIVNADFARIFATEAATVLTGFANQATAGAYDIIAGGAFHSTTNPAVRFDADSKSIYNAGGKANTIVVNTQSYRALVQNTFMRLSGSPTLSLGQEIAATHAFQTTHQLLPGYSIFVDELATDDNLFIYDKRAAEFLEGPSSMRNVELNYGQIRDTVTDRWYKGLIRQSTWGVEETNIHS